MDGWMEGWHLFPCAVYRLTLKDWQISGVGVTGRQHHLFSCSFCFSEYTALHPLSFNIQSCINNLRSLMTVLLLT